MTTALGTLETIPAEETDDDLLWWAGHEIGDILIIEATYFDGEIRRGKVRYKGQHRNPYPVVPGSDEHLVIPKFEMVGFTNRLRPEYAKYYRVVDSE